MSGTGEREQALEDCLEAMRETGVEADTALARLPAAPDELAGLVHLAAQLQALGPLPAPAPAFQTRLAAALATAPAPATLAPADAAVVQPALTTELVYDLDASLEAMRARGCHDGRRIGGPPRHSVGAGALAGAGGGAGRAAASGRAPQRLPATPGGPVGDGPRPRQPPAAVVGQRPDSAAAERLGGGGHGGGSGGIPERRGRPGQRQRPARPAAVPGEARPGACAAMDRVGRGRDGLPPGPGRAAPGRGPGRARLGRRRPGRVQRRDHGCPHLRRSGTGRGCAALAHCAALGGPAADLPRRAGGRPAPAATHRLALVPGPPRHGHCPVALG